MVLEFLSLLGTFKNSTKFINKSLHRVPFRIEIRSVVDLTLTVAKEEPNLQLKS